ncbi:MAG: Sir2 silent information regulator family NAD-dependent deacetylase [Atopobiaceae bacterium]|nr:Sir2 silent information regulator family NAD-dependent deacetylase [Atopobiaceae bacterium]
MTTSTTTFSASVKELARRIEAADAVFVGAGAGLSTACGPEFAYAGERFDRLFGDFARKYRFHDMYSGGFYPYQTLEEKWAFWSRNVWYNRYDCPVGQPYLDLLDIVSGRDYFVLTTNVDHQFQRAGFDKERLFYTQGDYGLFQCSEPCHLQTYDNYDVVKAMVEQQRDLRVPTELIPHCPRCGKPMAMNLRADNTFVQDEGWDRACDRYVEWRNAHTDCKVVYLELGVGGNTPTIIKYPFWQLTAQNPLGFYVQVNYGEVIAPTEIADRTLLIDGDAAAVLAAVRALL